MLKGLEREVAERLSAKVHAKQGPADLMPIPVDVLTDIVKVHRSR